MIIVKINSIELTRMKKVLSARGRKMDCSKQTGMSRATIYRALKEKNCSEETYHSLKNYCY